jgi:hypothetical protein
MSLMLTRFSQEVDVGSGSLDVTFFAIFKSEDGREMKMPISEEASRAIIAFFADTPVKETHTAPAPEADATVFESEDHQDESYQTDEGEGLIDNEEDVPSL